jgi:hypothetical protein
MGRRLDRLANSIYRTPSGPRILGQKYAFVFAFTEKGRKVCDGPFPLPIGTDTPPVEAEESLAEFPAGEIFVLSTRSMSKAKSEIKHILIERGENPDEALRRVLKRPGVLEKKTQESYKERKGRYHAQR